MMNLLSGKNGPYLNDETIYKITKCEVVVSHTRIKCRSLESKNNVSRIGFRWSVQIEDQISDLSMNSDSVYAKPNITSLTNHINMNTVGNETVYLDGENFGPVSTLSNENGNEEYVWYGPPNDERIYTKTVSMVIL